MVEQEKFSEERVGQIDNYNPVTVTVTESVGIVALAVIALLLLRELLRAQGRIRELQEQKGGQEEG